MIPFRVAMPNSVMKPISEATDRTPPATKTPMAPPINASGRFSMMISASREERKRGQQYNEDSRDDGEAKP